MFHPASVTLPEAAMIIKEAPLDINATDEPSTAGNVSLEPIPSGVAPGIPAKTLTVLASWEPVRTWAWAEAVRNTNVPPGTEDANGITQVRADEPERV